MTKMIKRVFRLASVAVVAGLVVFGLNMPARDGFKAQAIGPIIMHAAINGASEVPAVNSMATGLGSLTVDTVSNRLSFNMAYSGLSSPELSAHIHGPAEPGVNATVMFGLPPGNPKVGTWNYLESQEADILAGRTYINIHTVNFPDGEIRGQIVR